MLRTAIVLFAGLGLAGCGAGLGFSYLRADGQDIGDPALARQFETDRAVCQAANVTGDPRPTGMGGYNGTVRGNDAAQDCMEGKGYIVVLQRDAIAKQDELAAKAAEKARREAEAAAPPPAPPPPPPPHRVAAKPKPKPKPLAPKPVPQSSAN